VAQGPPTAKLPLSFWIVALVAFINSVSFTILIPILYPYAKELGLSDVQASLLTTSFALSQFFATPILGRLSDAIGRKPLLVISLAGTVLANLLAGVASVAWVLFAARILDGLTGGNTSIARAVISDTTPPHLRPQAFGWFDAAFRMGFVTGPAIAFFAQKLPVLPGVSPLGMAFVVGAAIALVATILAAVILPETLANPQPFQFRWQIFGLGRLFTALNRPTLGPIFRLTLLSGLTFTIFTFAFQPFFLNVLGGSPATLAILFVMIGVLGVLAQVFGVRPLVQRLNLADLLGGAIAVRGVTFLLIPLLPLLGDQAAMVLFFALLGAVGLSNAFPLPLLAALLSVNASESEQGEMQGINASYLSLANAIGPAISGVLVSITYGTPFWVAGVLTLGTAAIALRLKDAVVCDRAKV
jgi:predicted MFS family arabinose efflux permease